MPSCFLLNESFLQVYAHVEMQIFLFHVCARTERLLGLGVVGSNLWDCMVVCGISSAVVLSNLGLGWNIAADLRVFL